MANSKYNALYCILNRVISDAAIERLHGIFSTMDRGSERDGHTVFQDHGERQRDSA